MTLKKGVLFDLWSFQLCSKAMNREGKRTKLIKSWQEPVVELKGARCCNDKVAGSSHITIQKKLKNKNKMRKSYVELECCAKIEFWMSWLEIFVVLVLFSFPFFHLFKPWFEIVCVYIQKLSFENFIRASVAKAAQITWKYLTTDPLAFGLQCQKLF